jgi:Zn-dependent M16 (insulinase) family peptidase
VKVLTHPIQSSGILYTDIAFDFSRVDIDDLALLPLFSRMVSEAGTATLDETQLSRKIGAETGGISTSFYTDLRHSSGLVASPDDALLYFVVRGKAVSDKIPVLLDLVTDMLHNVKLDNKKRAIEMLKESKARKESSVLSSGHTFGATRIAAKYSFLGYLSEMTGGLTSVRLAGKLLEDAEKDWPSVQKRLENIRNAIVRKGSAVVNLTGDKAVLEAAAPSVNKFIGALPAAPAQLPPSMLEVFAKDRKLVSKADEGFAMPSQVNYVVKGGQLIEPKQPVSGAFSVVSRYLSTGYLWDNVRVVGGAYGGFASFSEASGRFAFLSYRDPNLANTLKVYDGAADALAEAEVTDEDCLQAIIGTVADLDSPMSPGKYCCAVSTVYCVVLVY